MRFSLGIFSICAVILLQSCGAGDEVVYPQKRDWVESVYASSRIEATDQYQLFPELSGRLLEYRVKVGDLVQSGDLIAVLDGVIFEDRLHVAEAQKALAQTGKWRLEELKTQGQQAKAAWIHDSLNFERQDRLFSKGIGSRTTWENTRLKWIQSKYQYESHLYRYQSFSEEVKAQLRQAEQNVHLAKNQLNLYHLYAIRSGKIYELNTEIGELVHPQQGVALIGAPDKFLVEMEIDERDITKIKEGQEVVVKLDAFPKTYRARVHQISQNLDVQTQTFHAQAIFTESLPPFFPGLTAESNIVLQQKRGVMVIPRRALIHGNKVLTKQGEKQIRIGLKNTQWVEVLEGIRENEELIISK
jgi:RND family efflux transporter MFP subunit